MVAHDLRAYSKAITYVNFFMHSSLTWRNTDFCNISPNRNSLAWLGVRHTSFRPDHEKAR